MSLYHEAAQLLLNSGSEGGSLKRRVFGGKKSRSAPNQLYALVLESWKWSPVLTEVIEGAELLKAERKLTPVLSLLLVHDLLLTKGGIRLPQGHGLRAAVERHKARLGAELTRARMRRKAWTIDLLREQVERAASGEEASHPRWVRINTLKSSLREQLETTFASYGRTESMEELVGQTGKRILVDEHVPNLVAISPGIDLTKTTAYRSGQIILQDKASCFPAYLLNPGPRDGDVVDACAAPGNKTTHLAAILTEARSRGAEAKRQTIFAFDKDADRAQTLGKMVEAAGAGSVTRVGHGQDFLQLDPGAERYRAVGALLLDPSCSGSGMVGREGMPELQLPMEKPGGEEAKGKKGEREASGRKRKRRGGGDEEERGEVGAAAVTTTTTTTTTTRPKPSEDMLEQRLESLSSFQLALLLQAFSFPGARKISYSTCSVHAEENERVVMAALRSEAGRAGGWRILEREEQVEGLRTWPERGLVEACDGDEAVAEGCIRSRKGDGRGLMGFFVAGFVRGERKAADGEGEEEEEEEAGEGGEGEEDEEWPGLGD